LFQEMHAFVAMHSDFWSLRGLKKSRQAEKVARYNRRSNLPGDLALIHGRDMTRHKSKVRGEHEAPRERVPAKRTL
jgi:hypothetical protein